MPSSPHEQACSQRWPQITVGALSCAFVAVLGYLFFPDMPMLSPFTEAERQQYVQAESSLTGTNDELTLCVGHAVSTLRTADEQESFLSPGTIAEVDKLRAFLNEEPPSYDPPPLDGLSRAEFEVALTRMREASDAVASFSHKLARQAQKVQTQLGADSQTNS